MVYNYKYKLEWTGLKNADASEFYYRLEFYKKEAEIIPHDVITLTASNKPFTLNYKSKSDYVFEPFRASSAEINLFFNTDSIVQPEDFYSDTDNTSWKVILKLVQGSTVTSLWSGYVLNSDIQYDWQDQYYLRLTASDFLGILKEYKYSDIEVFSLPQTYNFYEGISIKDFVVRCLSLIGLGNDVKFAYQFYEFTDPNNENKLKNETSMFLNEYAAIDWSNKYPYDIEKLLSNLMTSLGCILYLDNRDNSWTVLSINEVGTNTSNTVPYRKYNSAGTYLSSGDYDIKNTIARNTDVVFSDANQVVNLRPRLDEVQMMYDYKPKNLVPNYGFFQGDNGEVPTGWVLSPYASPPVSNTDYYVETNKPNPYDAKNLGSISTDEIQAGLVWDKYISLTVNMDRFNACMPFTDATFDPTPPRYFKDKLTFNVKFDYQINKPNDIPEFGFNSSLYVYRPDFAGDYVSPFFDGQWVAQSDYDRYRSYATIGSGPARFAAWSGLNNEWKSFQLVTQSTFNTGVVSTQPENWFYRFTRLEFWLRTLHLPSGTSKTGIDWKVDNMQVQVVPVQNANLEKYGYSALQNIDNNSTQLPYQRKTKKIESMFNSGFSDLNSAIYYEDVIFTKVVRDKTPYLGENSICSSNSWLRPFETIEGEGSNLNYLQSLVSASILSFYRSPAKTFTGNVYAEQTPAVAKPFAFPVYTGIEGVYDSSYIQNTIDLFLTAVTADGGFYEAYDCLTARVENIIQKNAFFFMTEASFDYFTNKTNAKLEEDLTSRKEDFTIGLAPFKFSASPILGTPGSSESNTTTTVEEPA
jgi:hypothetical protein